MTVTTASSTLHIISTFAGVGGSSGNLGNGITAPLFPAKSKLKQPLGVAIDSGGNIAIADTVSAARQQCNGKFVTPIVPRDRDHVILVIVVDC